MGVSAPGAQTYPRNAAITALTLPEAVGGTSPYTYTLTGPSGGNLPAGLAFATGTRILSGTPTTAGATVLTYTATDSVGMQRPGDLHGNHHRQRCSPRWYLITTYVINEAVNLSFAGSGWRHRFVYLHPDRAERW